MNKLLALQNIRAKLQKDQYSIGSWIQLESPSSAEIMGNCGYDWVAVDLEHGSISISQLPNIFRALELRNTLPLARISEGNENNCKRALDSGAAGVIIPKIETKNQLEILVDACKWPPDGNRGVGFSRANLYGEYFLDYKEEAVNPFIVAMIETKMGLHNISEILSVKGLDAILIGPYDLSASIGFTGELNNPEVTKAVRNVLNICKKFTIPAGIHIVNPDIKELQNKIDIGYRFLAYSIDTVFLNSFSKNPLPNL